MPDKIRELLEREKQDSMMMVVPSLPEPKFKTCEFDFTIEFIEYSIERSRKKRSESDQQASKP